MTRNTQPKRQNGLRLTRRDAVKAALATGAAVAIGPNAVMRVSADTDSGNIEVNTDATVPSGTSLTLTGYEDEDGDGSAEQNQEVSVSDGTNTYELADLTGTGDDAYEYWFDIDFQGDGSETPVYNSLEIVLPGGSSGGSGSTTSSEDFDDDVWRAKPDHVTLSYDVETLERYEPRLVVSQDTRRAMKGMYGYVARSDEYEYDVACYWAQLTHQDGLPLLNADSHLGDHEPLYVFINKDSGEVETITYTGYHWFASEVSGEDAGLVQDRHPDHPTHATFQVVDPWHMYSLEKEKAGAYFDLNDWLSVRQTWEDNGFYNPAEAAAIEDPEVMMDRNAWWRDGSRDKAVANVWRNLGLAGGSGADSLKGEDAGGYGFQFDFWPFRGDD